MKEFMKKIDLFQNTLQIRKDNVVQWMNQYFYILVFSFAAGIIIHLGVIIYNVGNGDTVKWAVYQSDFGLERSSGRWMLQYLSCFRNYKVIPIFDTVISILCISISSASIIDLLGLKNKKIQLIFCVIYLSSPFMNSYLYIYYTSDAYCIGILVSVIAAWMLAKGNKKFDVFISSLLIMCCLAIYQATLNMVVALVCIYMFLLSLKCNEKIRQVLVRSVAGGVMGIIMYLWSLKIVFAIFGGGLSSYKGMDKMGQYSIELIINMVKTYIKYLSYLYFVPNKSISSSEYYSQAFNGTYINGSLLLILIISILFLFKKNISGNKKGIAWFIISTITLGIGFCIVIFASSAFAESEGNLNSLISPQFSLFYGLCFSVCEEAKGLRYSFLGKLANVILSLFMCFNLILALNEAYYGNMLAWNQQHILCARILDRIEQTPGWHSGMQIAIIGGFTGEISDNYPNVNGMIWHSNMPYMWENQTQIGWNKYLKTYFGVEYKQVGEEYIKALASGNIVSNMPIFPEEGSVVVLDDIMVVKLRDY